MAAALSIDDDLHAQLVRAAEEAEISLETALYEAVTAYVDRANARASFDREALESLAEYERTGLHLTSDEMVAWLTGWEPGRPVPPCHT
ncbi:putative transcriptional regulator [Sphingomonas jinjuensis]|uniref:Putative transcriptional regulator n=1 Tax=Sphingomonas jinjuensis TaxID=535907 RepID=A0A840FI37_9SPHN|nr:CopG family transcriptional regulator [Sphingomonas jinjuensis]MBB4155357.1 putative transcriptional regulator [Sphingomonas jinjuensis]